MNKPVILCIDDETIVLESLTEQLQQRVGDAYDIEIAESGEEALELLDELMEEGIEAPVAIVDYLMPGMKGDEVMRQIHLKSPETLTILLSGHVGSEEIGLAINRGKLHRYIAKPWSREQLFLVINETIEEFTHGKLIRKHQQKIEELNATLEQKVSERTMALEKKNIQLQQEISRRQNVEAALQKAKEEAESANQAKSVFLANMSHELRTPLNGILGYAQFLQGYTTLDSDQQKYVEIIERSGQHLLELINEVLDIARIEAGTVSILPNDFHLSPFLTSINYIIQIRAKQKAIEFVPKFSNNLPLIIHADEKRLQQILLNLLGNAVKFTAEGRVTFNVEVVGEQPDSVEQNEATCSALLRFSVEDTGPGIPPGEIENIFQPFQQVLQSGNRPEGTGLGLAISRHLAGLMGSVIQVKSKPEQGSLFWFELEVPVSASTRKLADTPEQVIVGYQGKTQTILVIDDVAVNRAMLRDNLVSAGFKVVEAKDGQTGLELAEQVQPHLILTDIRMPELDGYELIRRLRQSERLITVPIIGVSASAYEEDRQQCLEAGGNAFLSKPIQINTLFEQLQRHLKLTWLYKEAAQVGGMPELPITLPEPDTVQELYNLSLRGDINALKNCVTDMAQTNSPQLKPFVAKMERLVETYRLNEISQWLEPHIAAQ